MHNPWELHNADEIYLKAFPEQIFVVFFKIDESKTTKEQLKIVAVINLTYRACVRTRGPMLWKFLTYRDW